ncbi:unnamed protein product [Amoebophrya sp. A25]|nr:unnamed protein product [Amoebophrya sp. A25]|eukprot:GSA25T00024413001.1
MPLLAVAGSALSSTSSEDAPSKRSSKKSKKADEKNGEDDGPVALVELWDLRGEGRSVGVLELPGGATAATAIEFSPSGMHLCVGDDRGVVRVYDIRSRRPLAERCHNNELPIKAVKYFQASNGGVVNAAAAIHQSNSTTAGEQEVRSEDVGIDESQLGLGASVLPGPSASSSTSSANKTSILDEQDRTNSSVSLGVGQSGSNSYVIASCDARCVKLWDYSQGAQNSFSSSSSRGPSNTATCTTTTAGGGALLQQTSSRLVAAFESAEAVLNDICFFPNSSLLFAAQDEPRVGSYFLPTLGPAPSWCGFLDSMTQELAETVSKHIYEEHTFLSKQQVHDLRAEELLGTKFLLPFHHGFLMQISIFEKFKRALEEERPRASQSGGGKNSAAGLFDFEERLAAKRQELAAAKRPMRVPAPDKAASGTTARVQANQALFDKLSEKVEQAGEVLRQKKKARGTSSTTQQLQEQLSDKTATSCKLSSGGLVEPEGVQLPESNQKRLLADDRFAKLFSNPEFEIEEAEIRAHDVGTKKRRKAK